MEKTTDCCLSCGKEFYGPGDLRKRRGSRKYCNHGCYVQRLKRTAEDWKPRFWSYVCKSDGCWTWTGSVSHQGYARFVINGHEYRASRLMWELHYGSAPSDKLLACHKCDNPVCVNPDHLFLGTQLDNMRDKVSKNRQAVGDNHGSKTKPWRCPRGDRHGSKTKPDRVAKGERNGGAKLTPDNVRSIRDEYAAGGTTSRELGRKHGVSKTAILRIIRGTHWQSVS
jgi:hypothetical protein